MNAQSDSDRFQVNLPQGWEDQTVYTFRGPEEGGIQHTLTLAVNRHLQHEDIERFAKEQTEPITAGLQGVEVLKDEETTIEGGNPAYEFVYKWMPNEGQVILNKRVFVIKDGMGFIFSSDFSKKTIKTVGAQLSEVIETLVPGTYEPLEEW